MNGLQVFSYNSSEVRTVMRDGEPWFCLKDVCAVLGISKYRDVAARLDPDEREPVRVDTLGGTQEMVFINESGLYSVILRSDKPEAKPFRKWVTSDVLPTIRKTGGYGVDGTKAALAEAKLNNSRARVASAWMKISKENPVSSYKQVCAHYASAALAGREVLPLPDTECCTVAGKDAASAWAVMDELMETLRVVKQRTYDSVMRKMERL